MEVKLNRRHVNGEHRECAVEMKQELLLLHPMPTHNFIEGLKLREVIKSAE